jgi:hypothetical protein
MNRSTAITYVSFYCNDAGDAGVVSENPETGFCEVPDHARLVVYQCGFEPLVVAVWSFLPDVRLEDADAEDLARDYLIERNWFADCDNPQDADRII